MRKTLILTTTPSYAQPISLMNMFHVSTSLLPSLPVRKKTALVGRRGQGSQEKERRVQSVCVCVCVCVCVHSCKNACVFMPVSDICKKESKISILRSTNATGQRWTWHPWLVKDREAWLAAVHGVTKNWTRLSSWATIRREQVGITTQWWLS